MAFSESVKLKVKHLAAFKCCRCQNIGIQIHHITPQEYGGKDELDNAAPLCPNCHDYFGANPVKRKEIKEMRDWWYERVKLMYQQPDYRLLAQVNDKVERLLRSDSDRKKGIDSLKKILKTVAESAIKDLTLETAPEAATFITDISRKVINVPISNLKVGQIRHNKLPASFINRIRIIHNVFSEVLGISLQETIDNFKRDLNVGKEILVWERMATVYTDITRQKNWGRGKKKELLSVLLRFSLGSLPTQVKYLSKSEIKEILKRWEKSFEMA